MEPSFFQSVYDVVRLVPHGRVTSYGAIAEYIGSKGSARMVGWAMNASNIQAENVPAHRVVNRIGMLTGKRHFGAPGTMEQLLKSEGVDVNDDQVVNFEKHFWNPVIELRSMNNEL